MKKIAALTILLEILSMLWINPISAQPTIEIWAYTDRAHYRHGDTGTLYITVRNKGPGDIILKNITVEFPWYGWYHEEWQGNATITVDKALNEGAFETYSLQFNVPSESRSQWMPMEEAKIVVKYAFGAKIFDPGSTIPINIATPVYDENIAPIYYLSVILTIAVIILNIELYFVWRRLGRLAAPQTPP
jgi:hypothetical protein